MAPGTPRYALRLIGAAAAGVQRDAPLPGPGDARIRHTAEPAAPRRLGAVPGRAADGGRLAEQGRRSRAVEGGLTGPPVAPRGWRRAGIGGLIVAACRSARSSSTSITPVAPKREVITRSVTRCFVTADGTAMVPGRPSTGKAHLATELAIRGCLAGAPGRLCPATPRQGSPALAAADHSPPRRRCSLVRMGRHRPDDRFRASPPPQVLSVSPWEIRLRQLGRVPHDSFYDSSHRS